MQQFEAAKARCPGALVLFRMGDFYELFGDDIAYGNLAYRLRNGAELRSTQLSDEFTFKQYLEKYEGRVTPMFAINNKQKLQIFVTNGKMKPASGWIITGMIQEDSMF